MRRYYDLHVHSCLSPCGSDDMTPASIAGMGVVAGLDVLALTDHNTCKNCPAFFKAAEHYGIIPVAGMELTTSEDIHVVCLFERLEDAMAFGEKIDSLRNLYPNREDIFGRQLIMDENDEITGTEPYFLSNAVNLSLDEVPDTAAAFGGICYPAHIDREANGIVSVLGAFPDFPFFPCAELRDRSKAEEYAGRFPALSGKPLIFSSDAHCLWDINGQENCFDLDGETPEEIRSALFERLRGR